MSYFKIRIRPTKIRLAKSKIRSYLQCFYTSQAPGSPWMASGTLPLAVMGMEPSIMVNEAGHGSRVLYAPTVRGIRTPVTPHVSPTGKDKSPAPQ